MGAESSSLVTRLRSMSTGDGKKRFSMKKSVSIEEVRKSVGVCYDEEFRTAFERISKRGSTARTSGLERWASKSGKRYLEPGFVFLANLKQIKVNREKIAAIASRFVTKGRLLAIPWIGKHEIIRQREKTLPLLYEKAQKAKIAFEAKMRELLAGANVDAGCFKCAPLKSRLRATEKAHSEYSGEYDRLTDVVRGMCVFSSEDELVNFYEMLAFGGAIELLRVKNRFNPPKFNGYRDLLLNMRIPVEMSDFVCELQIHLTHIKESDAIYKSHQAYEYFRAYFSGNDTAVQARLETLIISL